MPAKIDIGAVQKVKRDIGAIQMAPTSSSTVVAAIINNPQTTR